LTVLFEVPAAFFTPMNSVFLMARESSRFSERAKRTPAKRSVARTDLEAEPVPESQD
jgi:hypothetical protein